ncbi:MAG: hypothetical protein PHU27_05150 [Salinivirgaceae bacterium]|nr:hypothetical protein [Salinivirgaceae bacterium]MDD4746295.1 hypothetical protein [Salinivirgaceae bacterium]MDY0281982.1 hypothetical protein [Salinivirgaceae bacterium]
MIFSFLFKKKRSKAIEVKGTAVKSTVEFVSKNFPKQYDSWFANLPAETQKIYKDRIDYAKWYPIKCAYLDPIDKIVELFYDNDPKIGGEAMGLFAAEISLKKIYKVFISIATTKYIISRAPTIISTFFNPIKVKIVDKSKTSMTVVISEFTEITVAAEYRIASWNKFAIEMTNANNVVYEVISSIANGDKKLAIKYTWDLQ